MIHILQWEESALKILLVNKYLYRKGGAETYFIKLGEYLKSLGNEVEYFGMADERNCVGNRVEAYTENIDFHKSEFTKVNQAIANNQKICFDYKKINVRGIKQYCIEPYSLVNKNGIWYLIGLDAGKEKTYSFKQVSNLEVLEDTFEVNETLKDKLKQSDSLYHGNQIKQIVLKVGKTVAPYFQRQALFPNQSIIRILDNGDLLLECNDINEIEVLPIVKYWLPHITIISPSHLDQKIRDVLTEYLQDNYYNEK